MSKSPALRQVTFLAHELAVVESSPEVADTFTLGDRAQLRSGGPVMLVVDVDETSVTGAWEADQEAPFPPICLRRMD